MRTAFILLLLLPSLSFAAGAEVSPSWQPSTAKDFRQGQKIYQASCAQCHDSGENGAPKLADAGAWKDRMFEWFPLMNQHASSGYLKMPAMGKHPILTDKQVAKAVFYMTETLKGRR